MLQSKKKKAFLTLTVTSQLLSIVWEDIYMEKETQVCVDGR